MSECRILLRDDNDMIGAMVHSRPTTDMSLPVAFDIGLPGREIPDYYNDLNAIHEAVKTLSEGRRELFARCLLEITGAHTLDYNDCWSDSEIFCVANATAPQRCEAFLKTIAFEV